MLSTHARGSVQASGLTLETHDRYPTTAIADRTSLLEHWNCQLQWQNDLPLELLTRPARGTLDPHTYLNQHEPIIQGGGLQRQAHLWPI
jgi:hypothetical protein